MSDRNTIAQELTPEMLDKFIRELAALPGKQRTLKRISEKAEAYGIIDANSGKPPSLNSAKSFRDTTFKKFIARIEQAQSKALQVKEARESGAGHTLADAAGDLLSEIIFDSLTEENAKDIDIKKYSLAIARLRQGDVRIRALELAQFNAAEEALKHAAELKSIADNKTIDRKEQVERVRLRLFGAAPMQA